VTPPRISAEPLAPEPDVAPEGDWDSSAGPSALAAREDSPPLHAVKRRAYIAAALFGVPGLTLWITQGQENGFIRAVSPLLIVCLVAWAWALWRRRLTIRAFERQFFAAVAVFVLGDVGYTLWASKSLAIAHEELMASGYRFVTILLVLAFLFLDTREGLWVSAGLIGIVVAMGLGRLIPDVAAGRSLPELVLFLGSTSYFGVITAMLYALAFTKQQLTSAERVASLAFVDDLTRVANRRKLYDDLRTEINRSKRHNRPLALIQFDLDRFKNLNDTFGHEMGDRVLVEAAKRAQAELRASDRMGRWGGEEFLVLAPETDLDQAAALAERLRLAFASTRFGDAGVVTASFGVAACGEGEVPESLVKQTDEALYRAKARGRNRVECAILPSRARRAAR